MGGEGRQRCSHGSGGRARGSRGVRCGAGRAFGVLDGVRGAVRGGQGRDAQRQGSMRDGGVTGLLHSGVCHAHTSGSSSLPLLQPSELVSGFRKCTDRLVEFLFGPVRQVGPPGGSLGRAAAGAAAAHGATLRRAACHCHDTRRHPMAGGHHRCGTCTAPHSAPQHTATPAPAALLAIHAVFSHTSTCGNLFTPIYPLQAC